MTIDTEASIASIVHDVVDTPIEHVEEDVDAAQETADASAEALADHATGDANDHMLLRQQLDAANTRIQELETQWHASQTPSVQEPEPEPVQETIQETTPETVKVEIVPPPVKPVEDQKKHYLINHPLKR